LLGFSNRNGSPSAFSSFSASSCSESFLGLFETGLPGSNSHPLIAALALVVVNKATAQLAEVWYAGTLVQAQLGIASKIVDSYTHFSSGVNLMFVPLRSETYQTGLEIRKPFLVKGLRMSSAESIVTKRVALGELFRTVSKLFWSS
jgi:hypothetical protein